MQADSTPQAKVRITIGQTAEKRRQMRQEAERAATGSGMSPLAARSNTSGNLDLESRALLISLLAMPSKAWSLGSFGAIAEFVWSEDEPTMTLEGAMSRVTPRGGILIAPPHDTVVRHYTTPSRHPERRRHELALCLPTETCALNRRSVVTEIGPDSNALREEDRESILFDIGLGRLQVDCYVRTADTDTLRALRRAEGLSLFDPGSSLAASMPALSPHRVFVSRCGRIEVYQPIPPSDGRSPDGPHTHVLPKLLRFGRSHAANIPLPAGLVPCLTAHFSRDADHAPC